MVQMQCEVREEVHLVARWARRRVQEIDQPAARDVGPEERMAEEREARWVLRTDHASFSSEAPPLD